MSATVSSTVLGIALSGANDGMGIELAESLVALVLVWSSLDVGLGGC